MNTVTDKSTNQAWSAYNKRMKMRGDIAIWLSPDVVEQWHVEDRNYSECAIGRYKRILHEKA